MKPSLSTLICFAFFSLGKLFAQPTITNLDMPALDTVYHYHTASIFGVDFSTTGPGSTWDYTGLNDIGFAADSFANPSITPIVYQLVFNNFLYPSYDCTHAQPGSDIVLPSQIPFTVTEVFNFYKNSSSSFSMLGFGATINDIPTPIQYTGKDRLYKFPLAYGNMDTSTYSFDINVPTLGYWKQGGTRENHVDGYGTLLLPNGYSYPVLRLKSTLHVTDTVYVEALGFAIPIPRIQTDYKFLANGEGQPVLQITTQPLFLTTGPEIITGVKYKNEMNLASLEMAADNGFSVYPNPAADIITISNTQSVNWQKITLLNSNGQEVANIVPDNLNKALMNVSVFPTGNYYLVIQHATGNLVQKLNILH